MTAFHPTQPQPFTAAEAAQLDVSTIVAEISRLGNSLTHLQSSQDELASFLQEEEDADLRAAWQENEAVIASQKERVELLKHVLISKVGQDSLAHYGIDVSPAGTRAPPAAPAAAALPAAEAVSGSNMGADHDEGMHL